ncbi:MAG: transposase [Chromatiales bacterium]|nr:transposase [Chromatiales bacterium]
MMPRPPRIHVPNGIYHAILRGNHRREIFSEHNDFLDFEKLLREALMRYGAQLHAYCYMPNHVHLAIRVSEEPLGSVMHLVASRYARLRQRKVPTTGHFFERRYRAKLVTTDSYLLVLVRYIHRNPLRAGLVSELGDFRWSSHHAYCGLGSCEWLAIEPVLGFFGANRAQAVDEYRRFMADQCVEEDVAQVHPDHRSSADNKRSLPAAAPEPRHDQAPALEDLIHAVAVEQGIDARLLSSRWRTASLSRARAEIARRALQEGVATLSEVARRLNRAPSTLSELISAR